MIFPALFSFEYNFINRKQTKQETEQHKVWGGEKETNMNRYEMMNANYIYSDSLVTVSSGWMGEILRAERSKRVKYVH